MDREGENSEPLPDLQTFTEKLVQFPCILTEDLFTFVSINNSGRQLEEVRVRAILGSESPTWDPGERGPRYIYDLARKILSKEVDLDKLEPPVLYECAGLYGIMADGRHRVAAVKGINNEQGIIRAEVGRMHPFTEVQGFSQAEMAELEARRKQGLWTGTLQGKPTDSIPSGFFVSGKVEKYAGPWVFARDMEPAKRMYDLVSRR